MTSCAVSRMLYRALPASQHLYFNCFLSCKVRNLAVFCLLSSSALRSMRIQGVRLSCQTALHPTCSENQAQKTTIEGCCANRICSRGCIAADSQVSDESPCFKHQQLGSKNIPFSCENNISQKSKGYADDCKGLLSSSNCRFAVLSP